MTEQHPSVDPGIPLSSSVRDPDEVRRAASMRIGPKIEVYLDGRPQTKVIAYDVLQGTVFRFWTDPDGKLALTLDRRDAVTETLHGLVEVRWRPFFRPADTEAGAA